MLRHTRIFAFAIVAVVTAAFSPSIYAQWNCSGSTCTTSSSVGIGTTSPTSPLTIETAGNSQWIEAVRIENPSSNASSYIGFTNNGTVTADVRSDSDGNLVLSPFLSGSLWYGSDNGNTQSHLFYTAGAPRMVIAASGNVGIGTTNPATQLHVYSGAGATEVTAENPNSAGYALFRVKNDAGKAFQLAIGGSATSALASSFYIFDEGASASRFVINSSGYVGIGTTDPCANSQAPQNCKLSVAGAIQAYDVTVNNSWSDYVFGPDYHLAPLTEVAGYIRDHHHLPDIPSAEEVQEKGVSVGDMQAKLLAKIEELTLHMIEAEKENRELRERIARLEARDSR